MKIKTWNDGYILDADPRREDPLYYYRKSESWNNAIGVEVSPLYKEHTSEEVCISIFKNHLDVYSSMEPSEQSKLLTRVVDALLHYHNHWRSVEVNAILCSAVKPNVLDDLFSELHFKQNPEQPNKWNKPNQELEPTRTTPVESGNG